MRANTNSIAIWDSAQPRNSLLAGLALVAILVCIINCALPEIQMLLTGGSVPLPQAVIKIACFAFLCSLLFFYRTIDLSSFPKVTWLLAVGYLLLVFPFLWFFQGKEPLDIIYAYNAYYCPIIFAPVAAALTGRISSRLSLKIFLVTFGLCAALGWAQYILQDPVIQLASSDGNFRIFASQWMVGGDRSMRSNSFFGSSQEYGSFAVLAAAVAVGMCGQKNGWKKGVPLYILATATCYTTLTRAVFLQLFVATAAGLLLTFGKRQNRAKWVPIAGLALGIILTFSGITSVISQKKSIYDDASLQLRLAQWSKHIVTLEHSTRADQLFGVGLCQADKPVFVPKNEGWALDSVLIDNVYVALVMHIGILGLIVMMILSFTMWGWVRTEAVRNPTPLMIGLASTWSTFTITGLFNIQIANYGYLFLIAVAVAQRVPAAAEAREWAIRYISALQANGAVATQSRRAAV